LGIEREAELRFIERKESTSWDNSPIGNAENVCARTSAGEDRIAAIAQIGAGKVDGDIGVIVKLNELSAISSAVGEEFVNQHRADRLTGITIKSTGGSAESIACSPGLWKAFAIGWPRQN